MPANVAAAPVSVPVQVYLGKVWYGHMGEPIDEVGGPNVAPAQKSITDMEKRLIGKWCFALIKAKYMENGVARWQNTLVTPDGKSRRLIQGEVATIQQSEGKFWTTEEIKEILKTGPVLVEVRKAPDSRFPWRNSAAACNLEKFHSGNDLIDWVRRNSSPNVILFVFEPGNHHQAPDEAAMFAYLTVVTR